jgi:hypothetical protein
MSQDTELIKLYVGGAIRCVGRMVLIRDRADDAFMKDPDEGFIRIAAWESFGVNVRLLAEFLVRPGDARDYRASLYAGWPGNSNLGMLPHKDAALALRDQWWVLASQEVMHLSVKRNPDDDEGLSNAPENWIALAARDTLLVVEDFVQHLSSIGHSDVDYYRDDLDRSISDLKRLSSQSDTTF